jgi:hypothetical protein
MKALMNNAHGFSAIMKDKDAITVLTLIMFFGTSRTMITVVELLAAVCLVRGGHIKVIEAIDNFKKEFEEQHRFECLVHYFMDQRNNSTEFQLACMNFINVIVHTAEDVNFRVHLQYVFTDLGLDEYLDFLSSSSDSAQHLLDQISAYRENFLNVAGLVEEAQQKNEALAEVEDIKRVMEEVRIYSYSNGWYS